MSGEVLPRDVVTEEQSLADARKPLGKKKRKKKQPKNQGKPQGKPPKMGRRKRRNRQRRGKRVWVENYGDYLKSPHWLATRKDALDYHGRKCADCGATEPLEVHHVTYKRLGREKMKDLLVLCGACHRIRHEDKPDVVTTDYLSEQYRAIMG
jgi:5-methylcytosine-specific restriction endonuclease McrA